MHVTISTGSVRDVAASITPEAARYCNIGEPEADARLERIKGLSAALVSELDALRDRDGADPGAVRCARMHVRRALAFGYVLTGVTGGDRVRQLAEKLMAAIDEQDELAKHRQAFSGVRLEAARSRLSQAIIICRQLWEGGEK